MRRILLFGLLLSFTFPGLSAGQSAAEQPNILFIFADDHCFQVLGSSGHPVVETPNLDRLATQGLTFTQAYNQGSWTGAVCVASRTMLNTGRFLWHAERLDRQAEQEREEGRFWSEYMKAAGYETYMTGKWHVKADASKAFDHLVNERPGMPNQTPAGYNRPLPGQPDPWSPYERDFEGFWKGGKHWSEVLGDDATQFLREASNDDQPFFMYLAFNAPHDPRQSPKEFVDRYPLDDVDVPANFLPEYPFKEEMKSGSALRDEQLAPFPRTPEAVKVQRQEYYAIITHMDEQIGRILEAMEETGKADNTYIFFTADHGLAVGQHGLMGKQNLYDHSVRVPFIVVGPGVPRGESNTTPVYLQDNMPTTLELAGVAKPDHVQFHSMMPLIHGAEVTPYPAIYGAYLDAQRSIRQDEYKLILYPATGKVRLYHVATDPHEMEDRAGDPSQQVRIKNLFEKLLDLQDEMGDTLDLRRAYPEMGK